MPTRSQRDVLQLFTGWGTKASPHLFKLHRWLAFSVSQCQHGPRSPVRFSLGMDLRLAIQTNKVTNYKCAANATAPRRSSTYHTCGLSDRTCASVERKDPQRSTLGPTGLRQCKACVTSMPALKSSRETVSETTRVECGGPVSGSKSAMPAVPPHTMYHAPMPLHRQIANTIECDTKERCTL